HLVGIAEVHRLVDARLGERDQPGDQVVDVTEAARLAAVAEHGERPVGERLREEGRYRAAVVGPEPRTEGIKNSSNAGIYTLLSEVSHRQRLGIPLCLVVHTPRPDRV